MSDIFQFNGAEGSGWSQPSPVKLPDLEKIPDKLLRNKPPSWPTAAEHEVVRHFTWLSTRNFGIDTGFYPLGSCTMKHNPRINEQIVDLEGFAEIHPWQPEEHIQGTLALMWEMQSVLAECSGMDAVTLQPVAGAQGEFTAILVIKSYHESRGQGHRNQVIVPDSAHGTNPASAAMAGYEIVEIPSQEDGCPDIEALKSAVGENTAAMMITNPNTLGVFESEIAEAAAIVHEAGGQMYYDGANFNAIIGHTNPGLMGFDAVHYNLHKTFSQPHGGGGPGSGPIGVGSHLEPFLPEPIVRRRPLEKNEPNLIGDGYRYTWHYPKISIGKVQQWHGNIGAVVRAWAFYRRYGRMLNVMSSHAVLNAAYLKHKILNPSSKWLDKIPQMPVSGSTQELIKHEFTLSLAPLKESNGITAMDVAKRLLDYGYMAPTTYFPMVVPECLMIEPTETESKETLDQFAEVFHQILSEDPEVIRSAPHNTAVKRVDEVKAARELILRHPISESSSN